MNDKNENHICLICNQTFSHANVVPFGAIRKVITEEIARDFPNWSAQDYICKADLTKYRMQYVQSLLQSEQAEVSNLEYEVLNSMQQHELITKNTETQLEKNGPLGKGSQIKLQLLAEVGRF